MPKKVVAHADTAEQARAMCILLQAGYPESKRGNVIPGSIIFYSRRWGRLKKRNKWSIVRWDVTPADFLVSNYNRYRK